MTGEVIFCPVNFHNYIFLLLWCFPNSTLWEHSPTTKLLSLSRPCYPHPALPPDIVEGKVDMFEILSGTILFFIVVFVYSLLL